MNAIRWSLVTVCLSLLTACGGGGDKPPPPAAEAPLSPSYVVALSGDTNDLFGYRLDIVDPSNAQRLRSVQIDRDDAWLTTLSRSQSSDGRTQTQQHEAALYYVSGKRVYAIDLTRGESTQSRQVSSLADACRILWHIDSDLGGKDSWLAIVRAGADADCETGSDDAYALVHSSTAPGDTANGGPFSLADLVTSGRNAAGQLNRLITFERGEGQFVQWQPGNGLARSAVANGSGIPANADVRWLGWLPGFQDRGVVQINGNLHMLSWTDSGATLSASQASGVVPFGPFVSADASRLYVIAGQSSQAILAFDSTGAATEVAALDADQGAATELLVGADTLWVVQKDDSAPTTPSVLTAFAKATGAPREVDRYDVPVDLPSDISLMLAGVNGNRLVYAKPSDLNEDDPIALYVVDHGAALPRELAPRAQGIGWHLAATALVGQSRATTHVFWCDIGTPSTPVDCSASRFKSYNLASNTMVSLGGHLTDTDATAAVDIAELSNFYSQSSLISTVTEDYSGGSSTPTITTRLWQFKPDAANSLTFIVGASGAGASSGSSGGSTSGGTITSTLTFVTSE